jgi:hypothetical protein
MKSKAENRPGTQEAAAGRGPAMEKVRQLLLGMVAGMTATKHDLMEWVHEVGLAALREIFEADATAIAGPKGKHLADRTHHRWGMTDTELPFGGRHKRRNVKDHLPKGAQVYVDRMLREAYGSTSAETARKRLRCLLSWLESNGHEDAAASLHRAQAGSAALAAALAGHHQRHREHAGDGAPREPEREAMEGWHGAPLDGHRLGRSQEPLPPHQGIPGDARARRRAACKDGREDGRGSGCVTVSGADRNDLQVVRVRLRRSWGNLARSVFEARPSKGRSLTLGWR